MKRKILVVLLAIVCSLCLAAALSACGGSEEQVTYSTIEMEEGIVYFTDFSLKYTAAADSPNGEINESSLVSEIAASVQSYYLDLEFDMQTANGTQNQEYITIEFIVLDADVVDMIINYANTSSTTSVTADGQTRITATYSLPDKAKEVKSVQLVLELKPKTEGGTDIIYSFSSDTKDISGYTNNDITYKYSDNRIVTSKTSLEYTLNSNGQSYSITGVNKGTKIGTTYIKETYNGLPVTAIGYSAFSNCDSITKIIIPGSVTSIGASAFSGCTALESITIPNSVTSIGASAFSGCTALESITIPNSVTSIGDSAFSSCTSLASINVETDNTVYKSIDGNLYNYDGTTLLQYAIGKSEMSFTIPDSVTSIGNYAFYNCSSLTNIIVPDNVTSIERYAFYKCTSITSITLPFVGGSASDNAFLGYIFGTLSYGNNSSYIPSSLKTVIITGGSNISEYAFYGCASLECITIPDGVTSIGSYAFSGCTSLANVYYNGTASEWASISFITSDANPLYYANNLYLKETLATDITLESITTINAYAFRGCTSLKKVTIGNSITSIGIGAFYNCTSLSSITIPDSVTFISEYSFCNCTSLTSITIPDSVTSIGASVFSDCTSLSSITIPDSVTSISEYSFYNCTSLSSITIPDSVTTIGSVAFGNCTSLSSITIPNSVTTIGDIAFQNCTSLSSITMPNGVTSIGDYAFENCTSLSSITIPNGITSIGDYTFQNCTSLSSITIPDGVTSIGDSAFRDCTSLVSVTIPNSVTSIERYAFYKCTSLTSITLPFVGGSASDNTFLGYIFGALSYDYNSSCIPSSLKTVIITGGSNISKYAFYGCASLECITIPAGATSIGNNAFYNCTSLTSINVSSGNTTYTSIDGDLYDYNGTTLLQYAIGKTDTSLTIPSNIVSIGNYAFQTCTSLESITIPESVTSIGNYAFYKCTSLSSITIPFVGGSASDNTFFGYIFGASSYSKNSDYIPSSLKTVIITGGSNISGNAFYQCNKITSVTIGNGVTSIGSLAFNGCTALTNVTIGNSVTSIGRYVFDGCKALTSVTFENVDRWYVTKIEGVTIGTNISSSDLENTSTATTYLTSTYCIYYWYRNED